MTTRRLLDTHCHIDGYDNPVGVLAEARESGIDIVAVTEDPGGFRILRTRLGRRDGVRVALGLHPLRAAGAFPASVIRFLRLIPQAEWVGEIGLDFSRAGVDTRKQQLQVFDTLLSEPLVLNLPMTVHSRGAERETVTRLIQVRANAVLHWYTGPLEIAEQALDAGLWFSVNPAMLRAARGASLLSMLPSSRVLLETDGPFARVGRRPARPSDLPAVVRVLAQAWKVQVSEAEAQIASNQERLLRSAPPPRDLPQAH